MVAARVAREIDRKSGEVARLAPAPHRDARQHRSSANFSVGRAARPSSRSSIQPGRIEFARDARGAPARRRGARVIDDDRALRRRIVPRLRAAPCDRRGAATVTAPPASRLRRARPCGARRRGSVRNTPSTIDAHARGATPPVVMLVQQRRPCWPTPALAKHASTRPAVRERLAEASPRPALSSATSQRMRAATRRPGAASMSRALRESSRRSSPTRRGRRRPRRAPAPCRDRCRRCRR